MCVCVSERKQLNKRKKEWLKEERKEGKMKNGTNKVK